MSHDLRDATTRTDAQGHPGVLVVVCLALFFGVVNGSAVAVVLPEIGTDLGIAEGDLTWVLSGFLLTYGVAIPFYGRAANRYGARRLFLFGATIFGIGSAFSALATGLETLLAARTVQALGGAAVPSLGMTLASRAFPESRRGLVLGVASATMGVAAVAGPLGAGIISAIADWRYLFAVSAFGIVSVPLGAKHLQRDEDLTDEPLDLAGGVLFGAGVVGLLFLVTRGSQAGWTDPLAVAGAALAAVALGVSFQHQRRTTAPFIPQSLLSDRRYLVLTSLGFVVTSANLAAQIGFPFLFSSIHGMSSLDIGIALIPAAVATAAGGLAAGRIVDGAGAGIPIRLGVVLMMSGAITMSIWAGSSSTTIAFLAVAFGAGFALINTPLATLISLHVAPRDLAAALSLNTMVFFIGGSFGTALFTSIAVGTADGAGINPFHDGAGTGFSNAFAALVVPLAIAIVLGAALLRTSSSEDRPHDGRADPAGWTGDCQVPWHPELDATSRDREDLHPTAGNRRTRLRDPDKQILLEGEPSC